MFQFEGCKGKPEHSPHSDINQTYKIEDLLYEKKRKIEEGRSCTIRKVPLEFAEQVYGNKLQEGRPADIK